MKDESPLNLALHKHARIMPRATLKRLIKHWGILRFGQIGNKSYTITVDGVYVGNVVKEGELWRTTQLRSKTDLFSDYSIVITHTKLYGVIDLCADAERSVIALINSGND